MFLDAEQYQSVESIIMSSEISQVCQTAIQGLISMNRLGEDELTAET